MTLEDKYNKAIQTLQAIAQRDGCTKKAPWNDEWQKAKAFVDCRRAAKICLKSLGENEYLHKKSDNGFDNNIKEELKLNLTAYGSPVNYDSAIFMDITNSVLSRVQEKYEDAILNNNTLKLIEDDIYIIYRELYDITIRKVEVTLDDDGYVEIKIEPEYKRS